MTDNDEARPPRPGATDRVGAPDRAGAPERAGARAARVPPAGETTGYIDDRWTKLFVAVTIVVFALFFANAFLLGQGGLLTTTPSPSPTASPTVEPTTSPTTGATASPTPSVTATPSPAAPTASPTPTASATETPSP